MENVKDAGRVCRERHEHLVIDCPLSADAVQTAVYGLIERFRCAGARPVPVSYPLDLAAETFPEMPHAAMGKRPAGAVVCQPKLN